MRIRGRLKRFGAVAVFAAIFLLCAVFSCLFFDNGKTSSAESSGELQQSGQTAESAANGKASAPISDQMVTYYELDGTDNMALWHKAIQTSVDGNGLLVTVRLTANWNYTKATFGVGSFNEQCLMVPDKASILFDLNGYNLTRTTDANPDGCIFFINKGSLEVIGNGQISGGRENEEGGGAFTVKGKLTLSGGTITDNEVRNCGGAIYAYNGSTIIVDGAVIKSNTAGTYGGGIYAEAGATLNIKSGAVAENYALAGGGIYSNGATISMSGGYVMGNTAEGGSRVDEGLEITDNLCGGGFCVNGGTFVLDGGTISNNLVTKGRGGGLYFFGDSVFTMNGGVVTTNTASYDGQTAGGGVSIFHATMYMNGGTITNNAASGYSGDAGGIGIRHSIFEMYGGTVSENKVMSDGGAWSGGIEAWYSMVYLYDGKIINNQTNGNGGGITIYSGTTFYMYGGIISNNMTANNGGGIQLDGGATAAYLYGGVISNNQAAGVGGGINVGGIGSVTIGGKTVTKNGKTYGGGLKIYNNIANNIASNMYLRNGYKLLIDSSLKSNKNVASIGIHTQTTPASGAAVTFIDSYNATTAGGLLTTFFFADNIGCKVQGTTNGQIVSGTPATKINWTFGVSTNKGTSWNSSAMSVKDYKQVYTGNWFRISASAGTVTSETSGKFLTAGSGSSAYTYFKDVGVYTFIVNDANYTNNVLTFEVVPREVTIAWSTQDIYYSEGNMQYPASTLGGVVAGDDCHLTVDTSGAGINAGTYTVTAGLSGAQVSNYTLPTDGSYIKTYNILPRKLSKPYINGGLIYDGNVQQVIVGFDPTGMIISYDSSSPSVTNYVYGISAGTYKATIQLLDPTNFRWEDNTTSIVYLTSIVNKVVLSVSGISLAAKEYDGTNFTTLNVNTLSVLGVVSNDYGTDGEIDKTKIWIIPVDYETGNVATSGKIELSGSTAGRYSKKITLQLDGTMKDNYTLLSDVYECITYITRATIKVTGGIDVATDNDGLKGKVYDGTTNVTFDTSSAIFVYSATGNAVSGVTVDAYGGFVSADAGENIFANIWSLKLGGTLAENYELDVAASLAVLNNGTISGKIKKKDVSVEISVEDCVYGSIPLITYEVSGAVAGDGIKVVFEYLNATDGTTVLKTAGKYAITASLEGAFAKNYNIASIVPDGGTDGDPIEVEITKAPLTVTVKDAVVAMGEAAANNGVSVSGLVWGDTRASLDIEDGDLTFNYGDFATSNGAVGDYVLSIDPIVLANYTVTVTDGTLTVTVKNLEVTLTVTDGVYGGAAVTATASAADGATQITSFNYTFKGTSYDGTVYNGADIPVKPGIYTVIAEIDVATGYSGKAAKSVEIARAALTVTVTPKTAGVSDKAEYGENITLSDLKTRFGLTFTGWANDDEKDDFGNSTQTGDIVVSDAKWETDYFAFAPVGNYAVAVSGLSSDNYVIAYVNCSLEIEKANASVVIKNQSSVYDGNIPVAGNVADVNFTVSGLKRSADDLGVSISIANAAAVAGKYALEVFASNANYNVTFVGEGADNTAVDNGGVWTVASAYTVDKKKLIITAENKTITYGDAAPSYTAVYDGFIATDGDLTGPVSGVFSTELVLGCAYVQAVGSNGNVGKYNIEESVAAVADNYYIVFVQGTLTVERKTITVTVDREKTVSQYGTSPVDFTVNTSDYYSFEASGLAYPADDLQISLSAAVTESSNACSYPITAASANANYNVVFKDCVYTVKQFEIKVEWVISGDDGTETLIPDGSEAEFIYNGAVQGPKAYFYMPTGKTPASTVSGLQKNAGGAYIATAIIPSQYKLNYTFASDTSNTQNFKITPKLLSITWTGSKDVNGDFSFEFNAGLQLHPIATFGGVVSGETVTPVYSGATGMVGDGHTVTVSIADGNYTLPPADVTVQYNIVKMSMNSFYWTSDGVTNINASTYSYVYDGETHMPTALAGVSITFGYTVKYADGTDCGNRAVNAGEYTVTAVPNDSNYAIPDGVSNKFTFKILPKEVKESDLRYETLSFVYNGKDQAPQFFYADVNGVNIPLSVTVNGAHSEANLNGAYYVAIISAPADKNYAFTDGEVSYSKNFTIAPRDIDVEWTLDGGEWTTEFAEDYNGGEVNYSAKAYMTSADGEFAHINEYFKFEVTRRDGAAGTPTVWTGPIKDAGIYTLKAYISNPDFAKNYNITEYARQITIEKIPLSIAVNGGSDYTVNYNAEAPAYSAVFNGFVPVYTDANGNSVDESVTVKAQVEAVAHWIFCDYVKGSQPGNYAVTLTTNAEKLKLLRSILKNYDWEENFTGVTLIVKSTTGTVLVLAENGTNEFVYDGTEKLPEAFYTPVTGNGQQRKLEVTLLALNPDGTPNEYLTDGKAIDVGMYYISVKRVSNDEDKTELVTEGLCFKIIKRTVLVKISDRKTVYGEVTESNRSSHIVTEYLYDYGGRNGYLPLKSDEDGLAITVDCTFKRTDGLSNYDSQGYAQVGEYLIEGEWNSAAYGKNYEVVFIGGSDGVNGQFTAGLFTVEKADIYVISNGDAYFEEYGDFDSGDPRYVIKLADKTDGVYNNIIYSGNKRAGNTDAAVSIKYVDKQRLEDAVKPEHDAEYILTDAPRITAAGDWVIYYKIEVAGGNHNAYYGAWRVQIRPEKDFIIIIFTKEYSVPYGDGVPENLAEKLYEGGYYRLGNNAVSAEWFKDNAEAYVESVTASSEVGLYNIYFRIKDEAETGSLQYVIKYTDNNYTPETNVGKYRIEQRLLTVNWQETLEFMHDGEAHLPELSVSGWIGGGELKVEEVLADGQKRYVFKDGGKEIVVTVSAAGNFTDIGGHILTVSVGNSNYRLDVSNAAKTVSIKADTVVEFGHLPAWAWYAIGGGAALLALIIVILAVKLKKRVPAGGAADDGGFYETVEDGFPPEEI